MVTTVEEAWDTLIQCGLVSEETLQVVTSINGYGLEVLEDVLYAVAGYRNFSQYLEEDEEDEDESTN